jgi:hypothetical protein
MHRKWFHGICSFYSASIQPWGNAIQCWLSKRSNFFRVDSLFGEFPSGFPTPTTVFLALKWVTLKSIQCFVKAEEFPFIRRQRGMTILIYWANAEWNSLMLSQRGMKLPYAVRNYFPLMLSHRGMTFPLRWASMEWLFPYAEPMWNVFPLTLSQHWMTFPLCWANAEWLSVTLSQRGMTFLINCVNAEWNPLCWANAELLPLTLSQRGMTFRYVKPTQNDFPLC